MFCMLPSLAEAYAVLWGQAHGYAGKALRDGLDFWAGGRLAATGQAALLFDPAGYNRWLDGLYGTLPFHLWSYPPNYLLLARAFGGLAPWHAVLAFDAAALLLLVVTLRAAALPWPLIAAVAASPASLENLLEGQNAALLTALIGGGLLLLARRPRLAGAMIGLASIKPQLGLALPLFLLRRATLTFVWAALAAAVLAAASLWVLGPVVWADFWRVTRPAMSAVLLTGHPKDFAAGLISVFRTVRPLGLPAALLAQAAATLFCVVLATRPRIGVPALLIMSAFASPYLHDYDLLGATLAVALLLRERLAWGFRPGEKLLFFLAWSGPGLLPWAPRLAPLAPLLLALLLASALLASGGARGGVAACDSTTPARA